MQRYTIAVATPAELIAAHRDFRERGAGLGIMEVGDIDDTDQGRSFFLCDLNRNWWEIASARH